MIAKSETKYDANETIAYLQAKIATAQTELLTAEGELQADILAKIGRFQQAIVDATARAQSDELTRRTKVAIGCKYGYLAEDKKGALYGLVWEKVMNYSAADTVVYYQARLESDQAKLLTAGAEQQKELLASISRSHRAIASPDPIPCIEFLKTVVKGCACEPANGIFG